MKKILLLLSFLITISLSSQIDKGLYNVALQDGDTYDLKVDPPLYEDVREFFILADVHELDIENIAGLEGIFFISFRKHIPKRLQNNFGICTKVNESEKYCIFINRDLIPPYLSSFRNAVIYHELYHFLASTNEHVIDKPYLLRDGKNSVPEVVICYWNYTAKKEYFDFLKSIKKKTLIKKVTATVYNAVPAQTNSDPSHTASMFKLDLSNPYKHRIIAVSRDLLEEFPFGTLVEVRGTDYDGIYRVEDTMNKRYINRIDILINIDMKIGKWNDIKLVKL